MKFKLLLTFSLLICFGKAYSINSNENLEVKKTLLDKYLESNKMDGIDVYGIDAGKGTVFLKPDTAFMKFLNKTNADYVVNSDYSEEELENALQYPRPDEVLAEIKLIANQNPEIVRYVELGRTHHNREIAALELTSDHTVDKPVIVFNGMHHARELMTTQVVLSIAYELIAGFKSGNSEINSFLNNYKIIVVPQVNPDGYAQVFDKTIMWRKNGWPNQYGRIVGVDLNRNYPTLFNTCGGSASRSRAETYRGETAASEPETIAMINLMKNYRPVANISYHSFSELILYPFGCSGEENTASKLFKKIAKKMKSKIINDKGEKDSYRVGTTPELLYEADGMDIDTHWSEYGVLSFTIEINSGISRWFPNIHEWRAKTIERQKEGWKELIRRAGQSAVQFVAKKNYTYEVQTEFGKSFTEGYDVRPFFAPKNKVTRRLLSPGKYKLNVFDGAKLVKSQNIVIQDRVLNLGAI